MNILVATDSFPPKIDGVADTASIVAKELRRRNHVVRVIAPSPGPTRLEGCTIARVRSFACPVYPELRLATSLLRIRRLVRSRAWDGAIVLTPGPIGVTTILSLRRQTPLINIYTTDIPKYLESYELPELKAPADGLLRWMSRRAMVTLAPTKQVLTDLRTRDFARLDVWGRGVDTVLFNAQRRSAETRKRLTGGVDAPLGVYVGRLAREKRLYDLLAALRLLPGVRLAFVGDGPERTALEKAACGLPVVFTGYLRGEELAAAFASADLFLFPSDSDTFGQVVLQAMASGLPAVVARGSAPAEFARPGRGGWHVEAGRADDIAFAAGEILAQPALREAMSAAAISEAANYSWASLISRLEALISNGERRLSQDEPWWGLRWRSGATKSSPSIAFEATHRNP